MVGLDLSSSMLSRARRVLTRSGKQQVALCQGDALRLPFPKHAFQSVFLSFTLELFPDPEIPPLLGEIYRVLCPHGQLGIVALRRENTLAVRIYDWFHRHWPQLVDCRPIHLQSVLFQSGYEIRTTHRRRMWGLPVEILIAVSP